jgi:hypothetical protein
LNSAVYRTVVFVMVDTSKSYDEVSTKPVNFTAAAATREGYGLTGGGGISESARSTLVHHTPRMSANQAMAVRVICGTLQ